MCFWRTTSGRWRQSCGLARGCCAHSAAWKRGATYYLHDHAFYVKMGLLVTILALEIWPMITLMRWRIAERRKASPDLTAAPRLALISQIQAGIVILMVFAATAMARGNFH